ncbi:hypothetical protein Tdes44962_MAKER07615 [Teratosphaeria destructans]|uniref:Uncharacterized protein n=1 Tax=Teratosphaeria destructans TaxID=418781 RepID=A0A9W7SYW4_9PEZI|nr:hypothetical protein Tdes44962_MAKER07615 [Teratosphaeria destructans]
MDSISGGHPSTNKPRQRSIVDGRRNFQFFIRASLAGLPTTIWYIMEYPTIRELKFAWLKRVYPTSGYWKVEDNLKAIKLRYWGRELDDAQCPAQVSVLPSKHIGLADEDLLQSTINKECHVDLIISWSHRLDVSGAGGVMGLGSVVSSTGREYPQ